MNVRDISALLGCSVLHEGDLNVEITGCYVSDLLSDVMSSSDHGQIWITQHTHTNVVAVAAIKDLAAVVVVNGQTVPEETLGKAQAEGITILTTAISTFEAAGRTYEALMSKSTAPA